MSDRSPTKMRGAVRIFRAFDVDVHLHWAWIVVALIAWQWRGDVYQSAIWPALEYLTLFLIVLLHEFGHALACRSVGGMAENILLWPLGGVAYVRPPPRPGATLWSIAAGPLVNVVLVPVTMVAAFAVGGLDPESDVATFVFMVAGLNALLLAFNVLPIYPLDGGQMLRAVFWYFVGPHKSLTIAAGIGLVGAGLGGLLAISIQDWWLVMFAVLGAMASWNGLKAARARSTVAALPKRMGLVCPQCKESPPAAAAWICAGCDSVYDVFESGCVCPECGHAEDAPTCNFCGGRDSLADYRRAAAGDPAIR